MKEKQKPVAAMEAAKDWPPPHQPDPWAILDGLSGSLRLENLAARLTFDRHGAHVSITIPWAEVPAHLQPKKE